MKFLRNSVITLLILIGLGIGSGLILSSYYGDEVRSAVIKRLNDRLQTEVDVRSVNFSVLRKFPYASVGLSQVTLSNEKDTLFHFDRTFLQFDLVDLFKGQHRIERISFENGRVRFPIDERGEHPYDDIWKEDAGTRDSSAAFELERTEWENVEFHYSDGRSNTSFKAWLSYAFFQGWFERTNSAFDARAEGEWHSFSNGERTWSELDRSFSISTKGSIDNEAKTGKLEGGTFRWADLKGTMGGSFAYGRDSRIDLSFEAPFQRIGSYLEAWPDLRVPEGYRASGKLKLEGKWKGPTGAGASPTLKLRFELDKGRLRHKSSGIRAKGLSASGNFLSRNERGRPLLSLQKFAGEFGGGEWKGKGSWSPGRTHRLDIELQGQSRVEETVRFLGIDTIGAAKGDWEASLQLEGPFSPPVIGEEELEQLSLSGMAKLQDAGIAVKGSPYTFKALNGTFIFHDQNAGVKTLSGKVAGSGFELEGRSYDLLPYLFLPDRTLRLEAELRSDKLNLNKLLSKGRSQKKKKSGAYKLQFPKHLQLEVHATLDQLEFRQFQPKDLKGRFKLGPGGLSGKNISMKLADGKLAGHLALNADTRPFGVRAGAELRGVRLRPFFQAFESFGQELIHPEHLKGVLDAGIQYSSSLDQELKVPASSVKSSGDIEIRKGELIEFEPLIQLAEQLTRKKILNSFLHLEKLKERLHHVRFEELQNRIRIENSTIIIPRFDVHSNALDIEASGKHHFDGRIDYHFVILMDELLSKPKKSEFGYLRDEGNEKRLFVKMTGTTEEPEISFDRKAAREHREERRKDEKRDIKEALQEEFGLFEETDSTESKKEKEEEKAKPVFDVKWGSEKEGSKKKEEERTDREDKKEKSLWERLGISKDEEEENEKKQDE